MAIRGPFQRWRLVEPVNSLEDVTKILRELEGAYEKLVYVLEQGTDDAPGDAPSDAEYILGAGEPSLPNSRVLADGQNTTVDYGTPGEVSIDAPTTLPPAGPAGGDLAGTYPNPTVDGIQGNPVQGLGVTTGDTFEFAGGQWNHSQIGGDLDGRPSASVVTGIRTNPVEPGTPTSGDVYRYDGSQFVRWSPKYMTASLGADQTANLAVNDHVEFDTVAETSGHITLSTGAGQANGIFTLPPGTWWIVASLSVVFSAAGGILGVRLRNNGTGAFLGGAAAFARPYARAVNDAAPILTHGIMVNTSSAALEARIVNSGSVTAVDIATSISIVALA